MDDLSRAEYPGLLANLQPSQAVQVLTDRVKRISKINVEIADWLQERRKVEEQYVNNLRKLLVHKVPNASSELGVFQAPWDKILQSVEAIAASHVQLAARIEQDVELSLRNFQTRGEMQNMQTITTNLTTMAKELEDAQDKSDKLIKKGGKANVQKVDMATTKLDSATQQWDSQSPFIFETLQAVDEQRINHLRDVLTQLLTHEVDQATRSQSAAEQALNTMLEINTKAEIEDFVRKAAAGKTKLDRRLPLGSRQSSLVPGAASAAPSLSGHEDNNENSVPKEGQLESRLRSRIGTMLGRRRQSIHGGFGPISEKSRHLGFTRNIASSHGRPSISPKPSSHNLNSSPTRNRLPSLVESPTSDGHAQAGGDGGEGPYPSLEGTNGVSGHDGPRDTAHMRFMSTLESSILNGTPEDIFDAPPPPGPPPPIPPSQQVEPTRDADGFTIPVTRHDPISEAMRYAVPEAEEADQLLKLNIQNEPIADEDQAAKQAALYNVANTLQMGMPSRKSGTVRGRRDVRNTVYSPNLPVPELQTPLFPPSPSIPTSLAPSKLTVVTTLASDNSHGSDNQSIRSGTTSLGSASFAGTSRLKHTDFHGPAYGPGLHGSVIETVSAIFEEGQLKCANIRGEIAFAFNPDPACPGSGHETIRINNFTNLSTIGPNRAFVANVESSPDEFSLDVSQLNVTSPAFTYNVHAEDDAASLASQCPIFLSPAWKPQGDKLNLILQYRLNPSCTLPRPVTLSNVIFVASYEGARASGVQTKPTGVHLKDKHLVYWRLGDMTLPDDWSKIICRVVGERNAEPRPGPVEVRWEYHVADGQLGSGISVSRLADVKGKGKATDGVTASDPFADEGGLTTPREARSWADVPLMTTLVSGKYEAK